MSKISKKICKGCGKKLPRTHEFFFRNKSLLDGLLSKCKTCTAAYQKEYKIKQRKKNLEYLKKASEKWSKNNRARRNVRQRVYTAVKNGLIKKKPCAVCDQKKVEAHHFNYDKPLEVIWLCKSHHMEVHRCQKTNSNNG